MRRSSLALWFSLLTAALDAQGEVADVTALEITQVDPCNSGDTECQETEVIVVVSDEEGIPILGLNKGDFTVGELLEGEPRCPVGTIDLEEVRPEEGIRVALVIDESGSMEDPMESGGTAKIQAAREAATEFVNNLMPLDRVALLGFEGTLPASCRLAAGFTADKDELRRAIAEFGTGNCTVLYECVVEAVRRTSQETGVKAVIALTDGRENRSALCQFTGVSERACPNPPPPPAEEIDRCLMEEVIPRANDAKIPIYTIGLGREEDFDRARLTKLADETGGLFFHAPTADDLKEVYDDVHQRIRSQYRIEYCSECFPGVSGEIAVEVCVDDTCGQASYFRSNTPAIERSAETVDLEKEPQPPGEPIALRVAVSSERPIQEVRIFRRTTGDDTFGQDNFTNIEGESWRFEIPGPEVVSPGIDYYLTADDGLCVSSDPEIDPESNPHQIPVANRGADRLFIRCDPNDDGRNDIADSVWIVSQLFRDGPAARCQEAADCNDDGRVDLTDVAFGIGYQLRGGPRPPSPFRDCGVDPEGLALGCERTKHCD